VPADLRALYQNHDLLIRKNLTLVAEAGLTEDYIRSFLPADSVTLKEHKLKAKNCFPFAVCGPESYFAAVISPGNDQECAVALIYAGEREFRVVATSLNQFLGRQIRERRIDVESSDAEPPVHQAEFF